jgi:glucuronate isomerase
MDFIHDDFLLHSKAAQKLYHDYAAQQPILDYHSHLPPADIAEDRRFQNLFETCLEGDHYKWRVMRANGIPESHVTGDAKPYEKFLAWARTVPFLLRNPLYHWTHLELKRYFGINDLLDETTAESVWERANLQLQNSDLTAHGILRKFDVRVVCTTDDPCDSLANHRKLNGSVPGLRMYPAFRPDYALLVGQPDTFNAWIGRLESASKMEVSSFPAFLDALKHRHDFFHANGARLSDHGLKHCFATPCTETQAGVIFAKARSGRGASPTDEEKFASFMMIFFGRLDAERGWTKQLHLGALRNVNTRATQQLGPNTGYDNVGDWNQAESLCKYFDALDQENALPKTIIYNVNPADNYVFSTAAGSFQDGVTAGKIQFGSGWWFLDQKEAIEWQMNALSNNGLLSRFIGMVTDSRSFMSFPRHEYFRRVLCNLLGQEMERGELPSDEGLIGSLVRNICFENARQYLGLELPATSDLQSVPTIRT